MIREDSALYNLIGLIVRFEPVRKALIAAHVWRGKRKTGPLTLDGQYGIDSKGVVPPVLLQSGKPADKTNRAFGSVSPELFHPVLKAIPEPSRWHFVDIGAGKGAAMIIASEYPYASISGIELSPYLAAIARSNLEIVRAKFPERRTMVLTEGDASTPDLPDGPVVIGFMNSFYDAPLDRLLERLASHAERHEVLFLYGNPVEWRAIDRHPSFQRWFAQSFAFGPGDDEASCFFVWRAGPADLDVSSPAIDGEPLDSAISTNGVLSFIAAAPNAAEDSSISVAGGQRTSADVT